MVHCKWDKIHRCVRDIRLALTHSESGLFLKTQLFTSYLWGVNFKPFGTGEFGSQKRFILNAFMATESPHSDVFQKYGERISRALGYLLEQTNMDRRTPVELASRHCSKRMSCGGAGGLSRCPSSSDGHLTRER